MVAGPRAGIELLDRLGTDPRVNADRRFHAVRGHLLEKAGDTSGALDAYQTAARVATNLQHRRYLNGQVARLEGRPAPESPAPQSPAPESPALEGPALEGDAEAVPRAE
jgi:hypothetical protein